MNVNSILDKLSDSLYALTMAKRSGRQLKCVEFTPQMYRRVKDHARKTGIRIWSILEAALEMYFASLEVK